MNTESTPNTIDSDRFHANNGQTHRSFLSLSESSRLNPLSMHTNTGTESNTYAPSSILILFFMLLKAALQASGAFLAIVGGLSIWRVGILWSYGTTLQNKSTSLRANYKLLAPESITFRRKFCTPSLENSLPADACQIAGLAHTILGCICFIYLYLRRVTRLFNGNASMPDFRISKFNDYFNVYILTVTNQPGSQ